MHYWNNKLASHKYKVKVTVLTGEELGVFSTYSLALYIQLKCKHNIEIGYRVDGIMKHPTMRASLRPSKQMGSNLNLWKIVNTNGVK